MTSSVRYIYQPIFNGLKFTLHRTRVLNNVVIATVIEMVEMVEILDERVGKRLVERVRYVINNLLHLVIVKYGVISLVLCISTRLRLVTILTLLVKYLVIFHADPCNKSYIHVRTLHYFFVLLVKYCLSEINHIKLLTLSLSVFSAIYTMISRVYNEESVSNTP